MITTSGKTVERALASKGISDEMIYKMVRTALQPLAGKGGGVVLDVGCGTGALRGYLKDAAVSYEGADVVRFPGFPDDCVFHSINLDAQRLEVPGESVDAAVAVETIEHIENPRALGRELARVVKPGGIVIITTPNCLSLLSKLTLVVKNQFNAFVEPCYPAHITALVETDLIRILKEAGLVDAQASYSNYGRIPGTAWHWPGSIFRGRAFSDTILVLARKPGK